MSNEQREKESQFNQSVVDLVKQLAIDEEYFSEAIKFGLIVLDANVLLALYRIGADARNQLLETFRRVSDRLWVPHQTLLEFERNRSKAVENRIAEFSKTRTIVKVATAEAVDVLQSAVNSVLRLRERTFTERPWVPADVGLDRIDFERKLDGVLSAAQAELEALNNEHDLNPGDMQESDPVFRSIEELLDGKVGKAYPLDRLRALVEEANQFRYPNKMPPGYMDVKDKDTDLRRAGDYILWRQVIDKAALGENLSGKVVLITNDVKQDWWAVENKKRRGARPELVQELVDHANSRLVLLTLSDFVIGVRSNLDSSVSDATVKEISEIVSEVEVGIRFEDDDLDVLEFADYSDGAFRELVRGAFIKLGYSASRWHEDSFDVGFDLVVEALDGSGRGPVGVEIKCRNSPIGVDVLRKVRSMVEESGLPFGAVVASSSFTEAARDYGKTHGIALLDGRSVQGMIKMINAL